MKGLCCYRIKKLKYPIAAVVLLLTEFSNLHLSYAASSVYIPGVPSASSSAIGISCVYNYPAAGTVYCQNQSPGPVVGSTGVVSAGYQNRLMFVTPGSYGWSIPASVTKIKLVAIGAGGMAPVSCCFIAGGGGGGYSEKTVITSGGTSVSATVAAHGSQAASSVTVGGTSISAGSGANGTCPGNCVAGAGGCGSGGDVNTCGGAGSNGGGGAGGPYASGGTANGGGGGGFGNALTGSNGENDGEYGGYAFGTGASYWVSGYGTFHPLLNNNPLGSNNVWWMPGDIQGNGGLAGAPNDINGSTGFPGSSGGLGGGGGMGGCGYNGGLPGLGGAGGFGGGGGSACQCGTNGGDGGIGGGGGGACGANSGGGGNGIAIIYW